LPRNPSLSDLASLASSHSLKSGQKMHLNMDL
jgi:hypothetical protein